MMNEIIERYANFADGLITSFCYSGSLYEREIWVEIKCMNSQRDYEWDIIKLIFLEVVLFRFNENEKVSSTLINSALLKEENGLAIIDFFPLILGNNDLQVNVNSDFIIKCKTISYELIMQCN